MERSHLRNFGLPHGALALVSDSDDLREVDFDKCNLKGQFLNPHTLAEDLSGRKRSFRKDLIMREPVIGSSTCSLCNASYASDTKLREHQMMSHRGSGIEERPQAAGVVEQSEDPGV